MNLDRVRSFHIKPIEQTYRFRDSILYALGLGFGSDPLDRADLRFVYEQGETPLAVVPSYCVVLAHPGFWLRAPELEIDWVKILHGEQTFEIHKPLAPEGHVRGEYEIVAVEDKGAEKGAILHQRKVLYDVASGDRLATVNTVLVLRGDGGCGSFGEPPPTAAALPEGRPDRTFAVSTLPQSALIYRLSGDLNPIHADPVAAEKAGLGKPILQGLCTMGIAVRSAIAAFASGSPERIRSLSVRFSKPFYPGETLRTEFYGTGNTVRFRARAVERDVVVLDRGAVTLDVELYT